MRQTEIRCIISGVAMKITVIPQTDSVQELAHFWDTHDLTDLEGQLEEFTEPVFERLSSGESPVEATRNRNTE